MGDIDLTENVVDAEESDEEEKKQWNKFYSQENVLEFTLVKRVWSLSRTKTQTLQDIFIFNFLSNNN